MYKKFLVNAINIHWLYAYTYVATYQIAWFHMLEYLYENQPVHSFHTNEIISNYGAA